MPQVVFSVDAASINCFVASLDSVFETMLDLPVKRQGLEFKSGSLAGDGVATLIGISGPATGVVVLRYPSATAIALAAKMSGSQPDSVDETVTDVVCELANMVAGAAKAKIEGDTPAELSLPSIIVGSNYNLHYPSKAVWVDMPFTSDAGDFTFQLSFNP